MNRRNVLIALGRAGELTPERALAVRTLGEDLVGLRLLQWGMPAAVMEAAEMPLTSLKAGKRRPTDVWIQQQVDTHLTLLGLDPVPVEFIHPHLADRADLHPDWEINLTGVNAAWALHIVHHRVARVFGLAGYPAWKPLIALIERGIQPYGLHRSGTVFYCVDVWVDHMRALQDAWNEATAEA